MAQPDQAPEGYVKKTVVRNLVVAMFVFLLIVVALMGTAVKNYAANEAAAQATRTTLAANRAQQYANNRTTCGLRGLVDPLIRAQQGVVKRQQAAANDKTQSAPARARAEGAAKAAQKQIKGLENFRAIYGTIPPDFDCGSLPKTPPPFNSGD